jgi:hypothetical protein
MSPFLHASHILAAYALDADSLEFRVEIVAEAIKNKSSLYRQDTE